MMLGFSWGIAGVLVDGHGGVRVQPQAQAVRLQAAHHGNRILRSRLIDVPVFKTPVRLASWWPQVSAVALLDAVVSADDDALYVHWIHRSRDAGLELEVALPAGSTAGEATNHILAATDRGASLESRSILPKARSASPSRLPALAWW